MMIINKKKLITGALLGLLAITLIVNGQIEKRRSNELVEAGGIGTPKIIGEATLVGGDSDDEVSVEVGNVSSNYFAEAKINRQKARDSAVEILQKVVNDKTADEEVRKSAAEDIGVIATIITKENSMESLVKAKGFEEAVVVMGEADITVVVKTNGLAPADISKIKEIVMSEATVGADKIKIVEIK